MRRDTFWVGLALLVIVACCFASEEIRSAEASPARVQWEYKALSVAYPKVESPAGVHKTPAVLAELGRDGWEICGATSLGRFHTYTLKRSK